MSGKPQRLVGPGVLLLAALVVGGLLFQQLLHWSMARSSRGTPAMFCINNLRQLDAAAHQFAEEHHRTNGDPIDFPNDLTPYIRLNREGKIFPCYQGGSYSLNKVGDPPRCTLSTATPPHAVP
jgi:hypothetical protein